MKNIGIFYGSDTGATEQVAELLANKLGVDSSNVYDVASVDKAKIEGYDVLLFGSSTQGYGDLQGNWEDFVEVVKKADLSQKKVGVFGLGDSSSYSDTFCDAIGVISSAALKAGATLIGDKVDVSDYTFDESVSAKDGFFCGLALDEDNESEKTDERLNNWIVQLKAAL